MLYIIRHGKTDWNEIHKLQGKSDIPLNDNGRAMAREAKKEIDALNIDYCFSSPLIRAVETAEILMEGRNIPVQTDMRLSEMSFGIFEGTPWAIDGTDEQIKKCFDEPENYVAVEGGESFEELYARTGDFLKEVVYPLLDAGKDILIVGHGAMNNSIISQVRHTELKDFWKPNLKNCTLIKLS